LEVFSSDAQAEKNLVMLMPLMSEASLALAEKHKDVKITMTSVASVFDKVSPLRGMIPVGPGPT
jgi:hypothetical protein